MIENIVDRAKKMAIKEFLETGQKGLRIAHLLTACVDEFSENEDLPNTTNPDDWARISGKKGERIVYIRTLVSGKHGPRRDGRSTPLPTPASTCSPGPLNRAWPGRQPGGRPGRRAPGRRFATRPEAARAPASRPRRPARCGGCAPEAPVRLAGMSVRRVMGTETEYGISVPGQPGANAMVSSSQVVNAYQAATSARARRARWDFEEENPLRDARGFDLTRRRPTPPSSPTRTSGSPM
jgi:hypothetical protein